ncbi:dihydroxyacetone kinase subunit L [Chloroflexia bacterium SDU3-3]|nr:dihydroxyacetone kinase subunit L [Chloroflexia bacterium SDU3-3]
MQITADMIIRYIEGVAARISQHRDELTQLDSAIGDADHGANLDRGFAAVVAKLPTVADKDIGTILKTAGMTLVSTVGGASGPLYGTAYMRAGMALADRYEISENELVVALDAALEGIIARGKAQRGEKTMVDAIAPGIDALKAALASGVPPHEATAQALAAVEQGMKDTIPMLATKGRASYLGERSIGHQDPGATSAFYMSQVLAETLAQGA